MIPATRPMIPSAAITNTGPVPAFVDIGAGVPGVGTVVPVIAGAREIIAAYTVRVLPPGRLTVVFQL